MATNARMNITIDIIMRTATPHVAREGGQSVNMETSAATVAEGTCGTKDHKAARNVIKGTVMGIDLEATFFAVDVKLREAENRKKMNNPLNAIKITICDHIDGALNLIITCEMNMVEKWLIPRRKGTG